MNATTGFQCGSCGEWHDGLPDVVFEEPLYVAELPEAERARRVRSEGDYRVLESNGATHFFVRSVLEIPVTDYPPGFGFGVWVSLSEKSFAAARGLTERDEGGGHFVGWLSNQ